MSRRRKFAFGVAALALALGAAVVVPGLQPTALAQMMGHGAGHGQHSHGAGGMMGHDMATMPGLRGLDATAEESAELAAMFRGFEQITRSVENLPNGIRTVTFSADPELMGIVVSHVIGMIDRVDQGRDPKVFIQSPTLDILFERRALIVTSIIPDSGKITVEQTSTDPEVVAALQTHAAEVSDMVARGMVAVHEQMSRN